MPAFGFTAGKMPAFVDGAKCVARRVAGATMAEAFRQICAAVPRLAARRIGRETLVVEEQKIPAGKQDALIERKCKPVRLGFGLHRRLRHQIGVDRLDILVGDAGEMIIGECRKEISAIAIDAFMHGATKGFQRPAADAGLGVGCDIGRMDRAERRRQGKPAGIFFAALGRVADSAVTDRRQHLAFRQKLRRKGGGSGRGDCLNRWIAVREGRKPSGNQHDQDHTGNENPLHASVLRFYYVHKWIRCAGYPISHSQVHVRAWNLRCPSSLEKVGQEMRQACWIDHKRIPNVQTRSRRRDRNLHW